MKKYRIAIILFAVFEAIAVSLWLATGNLFFLLNFTYIGLCVGVGDVLMVRRWKYAREFVQFGAKVKKRQGLQTLLSFKTLRLFLP